MTLHLQKLENKIEININTNREWPVCLEPFTNPPVRYIMQWQVEGLNENQPFADQIHMYAKQSDWFIGHIYVYYLYRFI